MRLTRADRHRLAFASALTGVAFPAVWWANEESAVNRPNVAAVGLAAENAPAAAPTAVPTVVPEPAYLSAAVAGAVPATSSPLLVGTRDDELVATTQATFDRRLDRADVCWFGGVADGEVVTVVNRANGQSVSCRVVGQDVDEPGIVVLGPAAFVQLADFTDAPIHVELRA